MNGPVMPKEIPILIFRICNRFRPNKVSRLSFSSKQNISAFPMSPFPSPPLGAKTSSAGASDLNKFPQGMALSNYERIPYVPAEDRCPASVRRNGHYSE